MNWLLLIAAIVVGTWNGNWFPSGRSDHKAHPSVEDATITAAAQMLAEGIESLDPGHRHDIILCLNEIRNAGVASNLVARIGRRGLRVAFVSAYRQHDRLDQQQDVIVTTLPIVDAGWRRFAYAGKETPPRGFVHATVVVPPAVTTQVCAVHLKANYGARDPEIAGLNRIKRTRGVAELLKWVGLDSADSGAAIVAGDMNADKWRREFAGEPLFELFDRHGFLNLLMLMPSGTRGTHPSRTYGDSALDYIFTRKFDSKALPKIIPDEGLSDHRALFVLIEPSVPESAVAQ